jgi:lipopolysaccharide transport system permease protein
MSGSVAEGAGGLRIAHHPTASPRRLAEITRLLVRRELDRRHRGAFLNWTWPLIRQLVQLGVLVAVFSEVLDEGVRDYPVHVLMGLAVWTWFSGGMGDAARSILDGRQFLLQPGFPSAVLPVVAVLVAMLDIVLVLPVILGLAGAGGHLSASVLLLPVPLLGQALLMAGVAWALAAVAVHVRDVPHLVGVALTVLFYLTPVFYGLHAVPERFRWLLELNPLTILLQVDRHLLVGEGCPSAGHIVGVAVLTAVLAVTGYAVYRRLEPGLVDHL